MTIRSVTIISAVGLLLTGWAPLAVAQLGQPKIEQSTSFSDAELKSFAGAAVEVERIANTYGPKLKSAQTVSEQQKVELAASDEMGRAVTQEGLTVDRYKEILKRSLSDPEIAKRVKQFIRDKQ